MGKESTVPRLHEEGVVGTEPSKALVVCCLTEVKLVCLYRYVEKGCFVKMLKPRHEMGSKTSRFYLLPVESLTRTLM